MEAAPVQLWEVVGGRGLGGILVRSGAGLDSPAEALRLSTGAQLEEIELLGERLHFRRLSGEGPATGWVSTKVQQRELVVRLPAPGGDAAAPSGPPVKYFDLLRGPVERRDLAGAQPAEPDTGKLEAVLREYGVTNFEVESILRTELGRDKVFVRVTGISGEALRLFVGQVVEDGPTVVAAEASITAFLEIGKQCRPEFVSVTEFVKSRSGAYLHDRHILSPAHGPSDWGRSREDRLMLATAVGELHRASARAFGGGLPKRLERDLVQDEVGLGVLGWGLTVVVSVDVHTDLQFKNLCRSAAPGRRAPVLVDFKLGHWASRLWDLYFVLCGDDLCSLVPRDEQMTEDFIAAIRRYEEVSEMPLSEEETFLLMNTIMIKAIFNSCFFGSFQAHLPGSKKKCKAAFDAMEWIIARKDYFRSIF